MRILAISGFDPMPDRSTGEARFFALLKALAREHQLLFCAYDRVDWLNDAQRRAYRKALDDAGISALGQDPIAAIRSEPLDAVLFEYHHAARSYVDAVRFWQPHAHVLIDSVDVHFNRLFAKARVTGSENDLAKARAMKVRELASYRAADVVIAISDDDRKILRHELGRLPIEVIPIIQAMPPLTDRHRATAHSLLFIGNFNHDPNVDAMLYFCAEVFPLIRKVVPEARLTIVGNSPPEKVMQLACASVDVLGFVPDIRPVLQACDISVAPLRYGGGIKGKIAEAMAYGLPVVTTSIGVEGFGLTHGENVLVGDKPEEFAGAVIELINNGRLRDHLRTSAWSFVDERYSEGAVSKRVRDLIQNLEKYPVRRLSLHKNLAMTLRRQFDQHIAWRFGHTKD